MRRRMLGVLIVLLAASVWPSKISAARTAGEAESGSRDTSSAAAPLYMLTYDHGGLVLWGRDHFVKNLRGAIEWLDRYPSFKIGLDNEAYTYDQLAREAPEVLDEIRKYLKDYAGRFGIGTCTYGQPLSVFINGESNIRQIGCALEADRKHLGSAPDVYLMSEHAMHSQIPQILNGFGFRGAIMRTHFMMYGYNPTFDAAVGWWVGLDGSRIATIPTYVGQGAEFGRTTVDNWILTRYPGSNAPKSPADFRREFARIQPLLATRADDAALRKEELVKQYEGKDQYKWILLEEIFPTFPAPEKELKTTANDFVVRMPWGYCGNEIWDQCRRAEVAVLTAERLAALELLAGGTNRSSELEQAWKNLLVAQHHDIQICGLLDDARRFLPASIGASDRVTDASLRYIASQMAGGRTAQVTVYNPLSRPRAEWITVDVSLPRGAAKGLKVTHGGKQIPSTILSADLHSDGSLRDVRLALQADVPGLAAASYALVAAEQRPPAKSGKITIHSDRLTMSSRYWIVQFDRDGGISSIQDARTKRELLQPGRRSAFFAGVINGKALESKGQWNLKPAEGGAPWATARETGFLGGIAYTLQMTFRADSPRIDCRVRFHFDGEKIGRLSENKRDSVSGFTHEDKLRFKMFPAVNDAAVGVRDLPFAVSETSDRYVNGLHWTAMTDNKTGLAFFNRGAMGAVREKDGGFSIPLAYAMYYIWGTRMLNGDFTYEFAIYPFSGEWSRADLHGEAIGYNYPLVALETAGGNGKLGCSFAPVEVKSSNVIVSALFGDEAGVYLRMYEHAGHNGRADLEYKMGTARLREVDLAGRELGPPSGSLLFRPWQIRTVRIDRSQ